MRSVDKSINEVLRVGSGLSYYGLKTIGDGIAALKRCGFKAVEPRSEKRNENLLVKEIREVFGGHPYIMKNNYYDTEAFVGYQADSDEIWLRIVGVNELDELGTLM